MCDCFVVVVVVGGGGGVCVEGREGISSYT